MPRLRHLISGLVLTAVVAAASLSGPATAQTPPSGSYLETFNQYANDAPLAVAPPAPPVPGIDVHAHSRDRPTWGALEPMASEHGPMCEAPPATHPQGGAYEQAAFVCKDHLMTSIKASGYAALYVTPNQQADWSAGEAVIRFDASTFRNSHRDWWDLWLTPYGENLVSPLESWLPALYGEPKRAVHVRMTGEVGGTVFGFERFDNFLNVQADGCPWCPYEGWLTPSAVRRDTFELRISSGRIVLSMPAYNRVIFDRPWTTPLDFTRAVVQFGHHSYNPDKDCVVPGVVGGEPGCRGGTWHWDNLSISPSVPFTQIRAAERAAMSSPGDIMPFTFSAPAPPSSHLRVEAVGEGYEVSTDAGATWVPLTVQLSTHATSEGGFRTYWHPIQAGTSAVQIRSTVAGWWGPAGVDHVAIWSDTADTTPPTPVATVPTATRIPTDVPTATPAETSTPQPTFTPVLPTPIGASSTTTSTPMPQGGCTRVTYRVGQTPLTEDC